MQTRNSMIATLMLIAASIAGNCVAAHAATVYRCVGKDGSVALQDQSCSGRQAQTVREMVSKDPPVSVAASGSDKPTRSATVSRSQAGRRTRSVEAQSWECRTTTGMLFYRHSRCPASVVDTSFGSSKGRRVMVSAQSIDRREACRRMRNGAREGNQLDDRASTYERNLGRDTCGRN